MSELPYDVLGYIALKPDGTLAKPLFAWRRGYIFDRLRPAKEEKRRDPRVRIFSLTPHGSFELFDDELPDTLG